MRKNKLIQLLQDIEGNPEIKLWNGMVSDWMDIENLVESYLYKVTLDHYLETCRWEMARRIGHLDYVLPQDKLDKLTKEYKHIQWKESEYVYHHDLVQKYHIKKKVFYLAAKPRNITTWDRVGNLSY